MFTMSLRSNEALKFVENHSQEFRTAFLITSLLNAFFGFIAIVANGFIVIAMAKYIDLKKPCNALLFCLAISDLGVGLIGQPLYVMWKVDWLVNGAKSSYEQYSNACRIISVFFAGVSFITMTEVSLERCFCLHYHLRYESFVTKRKVLSACFFPWILISGITILDVIFGKVLFYASVCAMPSCIIINVVCYINLFFIRRRHHSQITALFEAGNASREPSVKIANQSSGIDLPKFRKSATNMFLLFLFLILCYSPYFLVQACFDGTKLSVSLGITRNLTMTLVYMNSSVNPVLYCYRISAIRNAVKRMFSSNAVSVMAEESGHT